MKKLTFLLIALGLFTSSCLIEPVLPTVVTAEVTDVVQQSAKCGGEVTDDGNDDVTAYGVVWSNSPAPTLETGNLTVDGNGTGTFTSDLTGLGPNITYYVRAYATNSVGTAYGEEKTFTTPL